MGGDEVGEGFAEKVGLLFGAFESLIVNLGGLLMCRREFSVGECAG